MAVEASSNKTHFGLPMSRQNGVGFVAQERLVLLFILCVSGGGGGGGGGGPHTG